MMRWIFKTAAILALALGVCFVAGNAVIAVRTHGFHWPAVVLTLFWFAAAGVLHAFGGLLHRIERMERKLDDLTRKRRREGKSETGPKDG